MLSPREGQQPIRTSPRLVARAQEVSMQLNGNPLESGFLSICDDLAVAVMIIAVVVTTYPHEYRIVPVVMIQDRHAFGEAFVVVLGGEYGDAAVQRLTVSGREGLDRMEMPPTHHYLSRT